MSITRSFFPILLCALLFANCKTPAQPDTGGSNAAVGNKFVDAFYSFNRDTLQRLLSAAESSQPEILYYQQWARCANYKVLDRSHFFQKNDSVLMYPVTVKDDLMASLGISLNVTDTFHIRIRNGKILSVTTSSNDIPEYYKAKDWVKANRPGYIDKACEGIWKGGPTPCDCVLGMIKGFKEFTDSTAKANGLKIK